VSHVYLVRHAKTLNRYTWPEPDHLRPLSKAGFRQAAALPEHLGNVPFSRLVTSPYVRCVQTLEPLAEADGAVLELADWLAEGAGAAAALELLLAMAGDGPVAACTHGDVILDTLAELGFAKTPLEDPLECKKGSTWILEVGEGSFRRGRYLEPPSATKES
jgi:8-oxo-dGTP diphosphatase